MVGPTGAVTSITGFGFASQTGLESETFTAETSAKSSGEHETSLGSLIGCITRGRVCESAVTEQSPIATNVTKARQTRFRESIIKRGTTFSLLISTFVYCLSEEGTAKDSGILATQIAWFNWQCDCFVTKRGQQIWPHRKKSRIRRERGQSEGYGPQRVTKEHKTDFYLPCAFCAS